MNFEDIIVIDENSSRRRNIIGLSSHSIPETTLSTISATPSWFSLPPSPSPRPHSYSYSYYGLCLLGGGLSSSVRWILTPIDLVKVNLQAHGPQIWATKTATNRAFTGVCAGAGTMAARSTPTSFSSILSTIWTHEGLPGLYRGLTPTILAYGTQSSVKYATYEYLKHHLWNNNDGADFNGDVDSKVRNAASFALSQTAVYMISAALAEGLADIFMCPWEMLKVKIQTSTSPSSSSSSAKSSFPTKFGPALVQMIRQRDVLRWPFGALPPLWGRQIIGTVANFVTFEHVANALYESILNANDSDSTHQQQSDRRLTTKDDLSQLTQLSVTFTAGYVSGFVSTVVSHPADTLVSLQARYPTLSLTEIIHRVGWRYLLTNGLSIRIVQTGTVIASQWLIYDSFKSALGMGTTGGN